MGHYTHHSQDIKLHINTSTNLLLINIFFNFIFNSLGLPPDGDLNELRQVWQNTKDLCPKPMTVLAALFHSQEEVEKMDLRLKVSKEEKTLALFLVKHRQQLRKDADQSHSLKPFTDFIIDVGFHVYCLC